MCWVCLSQRALQVLTIRLIWVLITPKQVLLIQVKYKILQEGQKSVFNTGSQHNVSDFYLFSKESCLFLRLAGFHMAQKEWVFILLRKFQLLFWCASSSSMALLQCLPQLWGSCTVARAGQGTGQCWEAQWTFPTQSHNFCCYIFAPKSLQPKSTEQLGGSREAPRWSWEYWN